MRKPKPPRLAAAPAELDPELDDGALFRRVVGKVKPVVGGRRVEPKRRKPKPTPRSRIADERAVLAESLLPPPIDADIESGEGHEYKRPGVQDAVLRKLRRGHYRVDAELDLHGLTRDKAHAELTAFLAGARGYQARCVRIIHGKGHNSGNRGPVIKQSVRSWLRRSEVLAYCSAPQAQGGSGATLVLLRAER